MLNSTNIIINPQTRFLLFFASFVSRLIHETLTMPDGCDRFFYCVPKVHYELKRDIIMYLCNSLQNYCVDKNKYCTRNRILPKVYNLELFKKKTSYVGFEIFTVIVTPKFKIMWGKYV